MNLTRSSTRWGLKGRQERLLGAGPRSCIGTTMAVSWRAALSLQRRKETHVAALCSATSQVPPGSLAPRQQGNAGTATTVVPADKIESESQPHAAFPSDPRYLVCQRQPTGSRRCDECPLAPPICTLTSPQFSLLHLSPGHPQPLPHLNHSGVRSFSLFFPSPLPPATSHKCELLSTHGSGANSCIL